MSVKEQINKNCVPTHVAVIMDGNGRWAQQHGKQRLEGHSQGALRAREIVEAAQEAGVKYITLYAFSVENWNRPKDEVNGLMSLLVSSIAEQFIDLIKNNVRLLTIGDLTMLPQEVAQKVDDVKKKSEKNTGLNVVIALSYGSRYEILNAVKNILLEDRQKSLDFDDLTEEYFSKHLYTNGIPDPELLIRTSGEFRISNFLLWQISYTEFYFTDVLWPDFTKDEFFRAIVDYQHRERRFGKTSEQIACK